MMVLWFSIIFNQEKLQRVIPKSELLCVKKMRSGEQWKGQWALPGLASPYFLIAAPKAETPKRLPHRPPVAIDLVIL